MGFSLGPSDFVTAIILIGPLLLAFIFFVLYKLAIERHNSSVKFTHSFFGLASIFFLLVQVFFLIVIKYLQ